MNRRETDEAIKSLRKLGQAMASIGEMIGVESVSLHTVAVDGSVSVGGHVADDDKILFSFSDFISKEVDA